MFCLGSFCPGGFWQGGFLSRGFLSGGLCPGGFCPRTQSDNPQIKTSMAAEYTPVSMSCSLSSMIRTSSLYTKINLVRHQFMVKLIKRFLRNLTVFMYLDIQLDLWAASLCGTGCQGSPGLLYFLGLKSLTLVLLYLGSFGLGV